MLIFWTKMSLFYLTHCDTIITNSTRNSYFSTCNNWSIENGIYLDDLKIAKVVALYKKGVIHDPNNHRPISLLSHFDKIFEKILCRRLISFLERNEPLYFYQYGFRKLYSTGLALIEITDYIKRLLDEKHMLLVYSLISRKRLIQSTMKSYCTN